MGHTEVAQAPRQHGQRLDEAVTRHLAGGDIGHLRQTQVTGDGTGIVHHGAPAAGHFNTEAQHHHQRDGHDDALDQVGGGHGQKAAQNGIENDHCRAYQHGDHVVKAEQAVEQLADGGKAGSGIGDEEDQNDQGGNAQQHLLVILKALGEELRHGDGVDLRGVDPQSLGHQQEVQVCTQCKADGRPCRVGDAGEVRHAGQAHQQPRAHVAGLGAHSRDHRAQLAAAQIEAVGAALAGAGVGHAYAHHDDQVYGNGDDNADLRSCHDRNLSFV